MLPFQTHINCYWASFGGNVLSTWHSIQKVCFDNKFYEHTDIHTLATSNYLPPIFLPTLLHWSSVLQKQRFYGSSMTENKIIEVRDGV